LFSPQGSIGTPPGISRLYGWAGLTNVTVVFSKPIADASAIPANFSLSGGVTVQGAVLDAATKREITLTTTPQKPSTSYTLTVNGVHDRTAAQLSIVPDSTAVFESLAASGAVVNVPEATNYMLVYSLAIPNMPNYASGLAYDIDRRADVTAFSRVAYYLELQQNGGAVNYLWVSMDAFSSDINRIGVPTLSSGALFQQPITNMNVQSSVAGIVTGTSLAGGNIEFWPSSSSPMNSAHVPNASDSAYDWGDTPSPGNYGCMQVHNHASSQVLFAFNGWGGAGGIADLGIGNHVGNYLDWTFAQNAASYAVKTLQVYVLPATQPNVLTGARFSAPGQFSFSWSATPAISYSVLRAKSLDQPVWMPIGMVTATAPTASFTDLQATNPAAWYRVRTAP